MFRYLECFLLSDVLCKPSRRLVVLNQYSSACENVIETSCIQVRVISRCLFALTIWWSSLDCSITGYGTDMPRIERCYLTAHDITYDWTCTSSAFTLSADVFLELSDGDCVAAVTLTKSIIFVGRML